MANRKTDFTEAIWRSETDLDAWINGLSSLMRSGWSHLTKRRIRSFNAALARSVAHLLPTEEWNQALPLAERYADGEASADDVRAAHYSLSSQHTDPDGPPYTEVWSLGCARNVVLFSLHADNGHRIQTIHTAAMKWSASSAVDALLDRRLLNSRNNVQPVEHARRATQRQHVRLLRDIFGNPFRPAPFSSHWRTDTVVAIAREMYASRDFSAVPILADALQDAGCEDAGILDHCRAPGGVHVRGCWVVDLVLGKT